MELVNESLQDLSQRFATPEKRFGATAASKVLFAIRPKALPPWDNAIRKKYVGENGSYTKFMKSVTEEIISLCAENEIKIEKLPEKINLPNKIVPKLIDEYNWMTITRKLTPPDKKTLQHWAGWSN